jgi:SAM-dependent methyltransferase
MSGIGSLRSGIKGVLKRLRYYFVYFGKGRSCPVCQHSSKRFGTAGVKRRRDAKCMYCGALERHRLVWAYFKNRTNLFDGRPKQVLHVAPEPVFAKKLKSSIGNGYCSADLYDPTAMLKLDITDTGCPDEQFDVIYCSHVLEHVSDDRKAMREFYRILKKHGWAVLLVPINADVTFEDPTITDPEMRLKLFGQEDHVRRYGPDFADRLRDAGFTVAVVTAHDFLTDQEIAMARLDVETESIFYCTKP